MKQQKGTWKDNKGKACWLGKKWSHGTHRAKRHPNSKFVSSK